MPTDLTPEQRALLARLVAEGRYASEAEALADALSWLQEQDDKFRALKREIEKGLESGEGGEFDEAYVESIKREGRERLARMRAAE